MILIVKENYWEIFINRKKGVLQLQVGLFIPQKALNAPRVAIECEALPKYKKAAPFECKAALKYKKAAPLEDEAASKFKKAAVKYK